MKIIRAFQVIKRDGMHSVSTVYNEVDALGNITATNEKDSFMVMDANISSHIEAIEAYIQEHRLTDE